MHIFLTVRSIVAASSSLEYMISALARSSQGAHLPENAAVDEPQIVHVVAGTMGWNIVPSVAPE